nr:sigma-54 dependent transcriptional regulator [Fusibacter paucivorans]
MQSDSLSNPFPKIIGQNNRLIKELNVAYRVSKADVNVLIRGESGTGKELVARSIHEYSEREADRWVAINCAAIPENLIESELFGHEAGAFTGAIKRKIGKIEVAQGGTLFLDEIGDLPLQLQVKLLRVLQEREYCRVGGNEMLQMDTRIIAATHRNLEEMIENGQFREDLYYRLNIVEIHMLPLRERQEDIPILIDYFAKQIAEKYQLKDFQVDAEVIDLLSQHSWKGNIRELKNILERSIILSDGMKLKSENLPTTVTQYYQSIPVKKQSQLINLTPQGELAPLEAYEKEIYCMAIEKYGSYNSAGKILGVTHKTVAAKHRKFCDV